MSDPEFAAIADVVRLYFEGMHHGDANRLEKAFHATARVQGYRGSDLRSLSRDDFVKYVVSVGSREAAGDAFVMHLVSIDRTGRAAVAKVTMHWNGRDYTDYLSLLQRDGGWSISEKTFFSAT